MTVLLRDERLDEHVARVAAVSRNAALRLIRAGQVQLNETVAQRASVRIRSADVVKIIDLPRFVSRGGEKLEAALRRFCIDPIHLRVLDIGISTGGFTDCLLQAGAASVIGVDVGHGQLAAKLVEDSRVQLFEGVNARELTAALPHLLREPFALITVDLSFISLRYVIEQIRRVIAPAGSCIVLVKPQFEVGRERLGRDGVVRDRLLHEEVLASIRTFAERAGFFVREQCESPVLGTHGNREFLLHLVPQDLGS